MNSKQPIPWLTLALVAANIILAYWVTFSGGLFVDQFGFHADRPSILNAFSSLFLHQNVLHLFGNLMVLVLVGAAVELSFGSLKFGLVYLLGGFAGVGAHFLLFKSQVGAPPLIGASACIAACIGFAGIRFALTKLPPGSKVGVPTWLLVVLWVILQAIGTIMSVGSTGAGAAFAAHLGGFALGVLASLLLGAPNMAALAAGHEHLDDMAHRSPSAKLSSAESILSSHPNDPRALAEAAEASVMLGHDKEAAEYFAKLVPIDLDRSVAGLQKIGMLSTIKDVERLKLASKSTSEETKLQLLKSVASETDSTERPNALLALAELAPTEPWAAQLANEFPMHPAFQIAKNKGLIK